MNILVTGGSSGLGKSIVEKLCSDKKNHIYFTYNNSIENSENICSKYPNATSIKCDFTNDSELNEFIENLKNLNINILINNFLSIGINEFCRESIVIIWEAFIFFDANFIIYRIT